MNKDEVKQEIAKGAYRNLFFLPEKFSDILPIAFLINNKDINQVADFKILQKIVGKTQCLSLKHISEWLFLNNATINVRSLATEYAKKLNEAKGTMRLDIKSYQESQIKLLDKMQENCKKTTAQDIDLLITNLRRNFLNPNVNVLYYLYSLFTATAKSKMKGEYLYDILKKSETFPESRKIPPEQFAYFRFRAIVLALHAHILLGMPNSVFHEIAFIIFNWDKKEVFKKKLNASQISHIDNLFSMEIKSVYQTGLHWNFTDAPAKEIKIKTRTKDDSQDSTSSSTPRSESLVVSPTDELDISLAPPSIVNNQDEKEESTTPRLVTPSMLLPLAPPPEDEKVDDNEPEKIVSAGADLSLPDMEAEKAMMVVLFLQHYGSGSMQEPTLVRAALISMSQSLQFHSELLDQTIIQNWELNGFTILHTPVTSVNEIKGAEQAEQSLKQITKREELDQLLGKLKSRLQSWLLTTSSHLEAVVSTILVYLNLDTIIAQDDTDLDDSEDEIEPIAHIEVKETKVKEKTAAERRRDELVKKFNETSIKDILLEAQQWLLDFDSLREAESQKLEILRAYQALNQQAPSESVTPVLITARAVATLLYYQLAFVPTESFKETIYHPLRVDLIKSLSREERYDVLQHLSALLQVVAFTEYRTLSSYGALVDDLDAYLRDQADIYYKQSYFPYQTKGLGDGIDRTQLREKSEKLGYYINEMQPDNSCLYASLANQLTNLNVAQQSAESVRTLCAQYIFENKEKFSGHQNVEQLIKDTLNRNEWGGESQIEAFLQAKSIYNLIIVAHDEKILSDTKGLRVYDRHAPQTLLIGYTGTHYDSLIYRGLPCCAEKHVQQLLGRPTLPSPAISPHFVGLAKSGGGIGWGPLAETVKAQNTAIISWSRPIINLDYSDIKNSELIKIMQRKVIIDSKLLVHEQLALHAQTKILEVCKFLSKRGSAKLLQKSLQKLRRALSAQYELLIDVDKTILLMAERALLYVQNYAQDTEKKETKNKSLFNLTTREKRFSLLLRGLLDHGHVDIAVNLLLAIDKTDDIVKILHGIIGHLAITGANNAELLHLRALLLRPKYYRLINWKVRYKNPAKAAACLLLENCYEPLGVLRHCQRQEQIESIFGRMFISWASDYYDAMNEEFKKKKAEAKIMPGEGRFVESKEKIKIYHQIKFKLDAPGSYSAMNKLLEKSTDNFLISLLNELIPGWSQDLSLEKDAKGYLREKFTQFALKKNDQEFLNFMRHFASNIEILLRQLTLHMHKEFKEIPKLWLNLIKNIEKDKIVVDKPMTEKLTDVLKNSYWVNISKYGDTETSHALQLGVKQLLHFLATRVSAIIGKLLKWVVELGRDDVADYAKIAKTARLYLIKTIAYMQHIVPALKGFALSGDDYRNFDDHDDKLLALYTDAEKKLRTCDPLELYIKVKALVEMNYDERFWQKVVDIEEKNIINKDDDAIDEEIVPEVKCNYNALGFNYFKTSLNTIYHLTKEFYAASFDNQELIFLQLCQRLSHRDPVLVTDLIESRTRELQSVIFLAIFYVMHKQQFYKQPYLEYASSQRYLKDIRKNNKIIFFEGDWSQFIGYAAKLHDLAPEITFLPGKTIWRLCIKLCGGEDKLSRFEKTQINHFTEIDELIFINLTQLGKQAALQTQEFFFTLHQALQTVGAVLKHAIEDEKDSSSSKLAIAKMSYISAVLNLIHQRIIDILKPDSWIDLNAAQCEYLQQIYYTVLQGLAVTMDDYAAHVKTLQDPQTSKIWKSFNFEEKKSSRAHGTLSLTVSFFAAPVVTAETIDDPKERHQRLKEKIEYSLRSIDSLALLDLFTLQKKFSNLIDDLFVYAASIVKDQGIILSKPCPLLVVIGLMIEHERTTLKLTAKQAIDFFGLIETLRNQFELAFASQYQKKFHKLFQENIRKYVDKTAGAVMETYIELTLEKFIEDKEIKKSIEWLSGLFSFALDKTKMLNEWQLLAIFYLQEQPLWWRHFFTALLGSQDHDSVLYDTKSWSEKPVAKLIAEAIVRIIVPNRIQHFVELLYRTCRQNADETIVKHAANILYHMLSAINECVAAVRIKAYVINAMFTSICIMNIQKDHAGEHGTLQALIPLQQGLTILQTQSLVILAHNLEDYRRASLAYRYKIIAWLDDWRQKSACSESRLQPQYMDRLKNSFAETMNPNKRLTLELYNWQVASKKFASQQMILPSRGQRDLIFMDYLCWALTPSSMQSEYYDAWLQNMITIYSAECLQPRSRRPLLDSVSAIVESGIESREFNVLGDERASVISNFLTDSQMPNEHSLVGMLRELDLTSASQRLGLLLKLLAKQKKIPLEQLNSYPFKFTADLATLEEQKVEVKILIQQHAPDKWLHNICDNLGVILTDNLSRVPDFTSLLYAEFSGLVDEKSTPCVPSLLSRLRDTLQIIVGIYLTPGKPGALRRAVLTKCAYYLLLWVQNTFKLSTKPNFSTAQRYYLEKILHCVFADGLGWKHDKSLALLETKQQGALIMDYQLLNFYHYVLMPKEREQLQPLLDTIAYIDNSLADAMTSSSSSTFTRILSRLRRLPSNTPTVTKVLYESKAKSLEDALFFQYEALAPKPIILLDEKDAKQLIENGEKNLTAQPIFNCRPLLRNHLFALPDDKLMIFLDSIDKTNKKHEPWLRDCYQDLLALYINKWQWSWESKLPQTPLVQRMQVLFYNYVVYFIYAAVDQLKTFVDRVQENGSTGILKHDNNFLQKLFTNLLMKGYFAWLLRDKQWAVLRLHEQGGLQVTLQKENKLQADKGEWSIDEKDSKNNVNVLTFSSLQRLLYWCGWKTPCKWLEFYDREPCLEFAVTQILQNTKWTDLGGALYVNFNRFKLNSLLSIMTPKNHNSQPKLEKKHPITQALIANLINIFMMSVQAIKLDHFELIHLLIDSKKLTLVDLQWAVIDSILQGATLRAPCYEKIDDAIDIGYQDYGLMSHANAGAQLVLSVKTIIHKIRVTEFPDDDAEIREKVAEVFSSPIDEKKSTFSAKASEGATRIHNFLTKCCGFDITLERVISYQDYLLQELVIPALTQALALENELAIKLIGSFDEDKIIAPTLLLLSVSDDVCKEIRALKRIAILEVARKAGEQASLTQLLLLVQFSPDTHNLEANFTLKFSTMFGQTQESQSSTDSKSQASVATLKGLFQIGIRQTQGALRELCHEVIKQEPAMIISEFLLGLAKRITDKSDAKELETLTKNLHAGQKQMLELLGASLSKAFTGELSRNIAAIFSPSNIDACFEVQGVVLSPSPFGILLLS